MNFKTVLIIGMVVSLLMGVFMGVYVSKPIVRDNTIVEVNSIREWVIPYNTGDKTQSKFRVIETEI